MRNFVVFALATASVERNLRFLDEDNERELDLSSPDGDGDSSSPAGTTTPEVTTKTDVTTTTASDSGDATTTSSTDPSDTTTASTGQSQPTDPVTTDPTPSVVTGEFSCYFAKGQYPELSDDKTKFVISAITCNIPEKPSVEPETTTAAADPAGGRLLDDVRNITIADKTSNACTIVQDKPNLYTCTFGDKKPSVNSVTVDVVSNYFPDNKTEVYLGCNVGKNLHKAGEKIPETSVCDEEVFAKGNYTGSCVVGVDSKTKKQIFELNLYDEDEYTGCNCTATWNGGYKKAHPIPEGANITIGGDKVTEFKPCKDGKTMEIQCTANGWEAVDPITDRCQWDDGAVSSTVSTLLLVVVALLSIIF